MHVHSFPRIKSLTLATGALMATLSMPAASLEAIPDVEWQPLAAQAKRVVQAMDYLGSPLSKPDKRELNRLTNGKAGDDHAVKLQQILDRYCLFAVDINPEMRVKVAEGPAKPVLMQNGWRQFLVKVHNESGTTAPLVGLSPNAASVFESRSFNNLSDRAFFPPNKNRARTAGDLWLELQTYDAQPLGKTLSGLAVEYRIVQLYSRDAGKREAKVSFNVGQGTQDIGFRNEVDVLFDCLPARQITLGVTDENGKPTTASFVIRDARGHVYPSQAKRLAPDFAFHPQVYRADGELILLPDGEYEIEFNRGPESIVQTRKVQISRATKRLEFKVTRWIDPSLTGWWSGDHHIHAAGCKHYTKPSEGVHADDMLRHCIGEDLKIGCNLTWGPCFDYQKQFFTSKDDKVSQYPYLLHYDVEVSGFGSHRSGHLCLLQLKEQVYPGGDSKDHWPTLGLNTLRWAKKQGAVVGPAHSGWGLSLPDAKLPNYQMPPFDGIGANEYIVDVTHNIPDHTGKLVPAVDFMSTVDTPYVWELNIWYHTLNVGFRTRISGETDFPCIYGEKVGLGRSYVKLDGKLTYADWCEGIRAGRNYVGDGKSHLMDFQVNDVKVGENGSELRLAKPGKVSVSARVAARLNEKPNPELRDRPYDQKPYWDIERSRIGDSRKVKLEVIVNGEPVSRVDFIADGKQRNVRLDVPISKSGWVAMRILPSSHTNPIFVIVDDKPVRASKRSAEWCLKAVDQCWSQKERTYAENEKQQARNDYAHARDVYRRLIGESSK